MSVALTSLRHKKQQYFQFQRGLALESYWTSEHRVVQKRAVRGPLDSQFVQLSARYPEYPLLIKICDIPSFDVNWNGLRHRQRKYRGIQCHVHHP